MWPAIHAPAIGKANDSEPKYFAEFNAVVADIPLDQINTYLRWQLLHAYAGTSMPEAFDTESWNFYAHILNGAEKQQERWKRAPAALTAKWARLSARSTSRSITAAQAAGPQHDAGH